MNYQEAVDYIEEIPKFTKKHTLSHTAEFLKRLGNPQTGQKIIHVAGTNGKGSVCAYMQAILRAEGKHVGFFTSPHLVSINERIRIDNQQIDDNTFLEAFLYVKKVVDKMEAEGMEHPSYFEFLFGMGMVVFAAEKPDYIILETGLGGRLDATNAVEDPVLTIITSISLDHTAYLGNTIKEIAAEKAGIVKKGVPIICDGSNKEALSVIKNRAAKLSSECREISKNAFEITEITDKHIAFLRRNAYDDSIPWRLGSCGIYQAMNASISIAAMEYLLFPEEEKMEYKDRAVHYQLWKEALFTVTWECRMEEVLPGVFVDGAHNPGAIEAFVESARAVEALAVSQGGEGVYPVVLFSAVEDKEYEQMIKYLCRNLRVKAYVVTEVLDKRKVPADRLGQVFRKYTDQEIIVKADIEEAFREALEKKAPGGRVYCLGSLYLAGRIKELLNGRSTVC
ncbi:MAG: folylpolyglutamate synthase/dihydrofolate synthase family protein [Lachnoclostridium sp.]